MFNVGTGELLVILLVALLVLGPTKLPDAARQVGKFMGEIRRMSSGFQDELRDAMQEPVDSLKGTIKGDPVPKATPAPAVKPVSQVIDQSMPVERTDGATPDAPTDPVVPGEPTDPVSAGEPTDPAVLDEAAPDEAAAADPSSTSLGGPAAAAGQVDDHAGDDGEALTAAVRTAPAPTPAD